MKDDWPLVLFFVAVVLGVLYYNSRKELASTEQSVRFQKYLRACQCRESGETFTMDERPITEYTCTERGGVTDIETYANYIDFLYKEARNHKSSLCPEPE